MKKWIPLSIPGAVFLFTISALAFLPDLISWVEYPSFRFMPYIIFAAGCVLGIFFLQSRISFLCILLSVILAWLDNLYFGIRAGDMANTVIFLSSIYIPVLGLLFYHLGERGVFTVNGYIRLVIVLSAIVVILLVPKITGINESVFSTGMVLFRPVAIWLNIPLLGILTLAACGPFFFIRNGFESPSLGPLILAGVLFSFAALNFSAPVWEDGIRRAVLTAFMSGSAMTLTWAVLESSWRNAHIDELTELPGRRSFKRHLERLSSDYSIAMVDVDFFKKVNDRYGHSTGDQVLRYVASFLRKDIPGRAYRYGGEEFAIIFEKVDYDRAGEELENLRNAISSRPFVIRSRLRPTEKPEDAAAVRSVNKASRKKYIVVTVSIGVARDGKRFATPHEVLQAADKALYKAKADGRDRVVRSR